MFLLQEKTNQNSSSGKSVYRRLPPGIWSLGFVSMFMDISSELVHSILPVFMSTVLGTPIITIGIIEGIAEGTASVIKVFSGVISDYCGKRKSLAVIGYTLGAITKPVFAIAPTIVWVFGARFVDRVGKGIRGAPRDALVADIAPAGLRGAAYGLRQSLDSVGAFIGPLLALILMMWFSDNIRAVLGWAVVPGFIAVFLLIFAVHEPRCQSRISDGQPNPLKLNDMMRLPGNYWRVVVFGAVFTLSRFSEAFLILRAQDAGLAIGFIPLVMVIMNIFYSVFAYPAGAAADRFSGKTILFFGLAILIIADIILALAKSPLATFAGAAFWGLHMAFTQGLFSKLVADTAPADLRGTAFGVFNLVSGAAILLASIVAGSLWSAFGAYSTFISGALFAFFAIIGLFFFLPEA
jgi:MFS family permease